MYDLERNHQKQKAIIKNKCYTIKTRRPLIFSYVKYLLDVFLGIIV